MFRYIRLNVLSYSSFHKWLFMDIFISTLFWSKMAQTAVYIYRLLNWHFDKLILLSIYLCSRGFLLFSFYIDETLHLFVPVHDLFVHIPSFLYFNCTIRLFLYMFRYLHHRFGKGTAKNSTELFHSFRIECILMLEWLRHTV